MISAHQLGEARVRAFAHIDWYMLLSALAISLLGLVTMRSFIPEAAFFEHQLVWIGVSLIGFLFASMVDYSFLRRTPIVVGLVRMHLVEAAEHENRVLPMLHIAWVASIAFFALHGFRFF
jgi:uncharacterized membrane protein